MVNAHNLILKIGVSKFLSNLLYLQKGKSYETDRAEFGEDI